MSKNNSLLSQNMENTWKSGRDTKSWQMQKHESETNATQKSQNDIVSTLHVMIRKRSPSLNAIQTRMMIHGND